MNKPVKPNGILRCDVELVELYTATPANTHIMLKMKDICGSNTSAIKVLDSDNFSTNQSNETGLTEEHSQHQSYRSTGLHCPLRGCGPICCQHHDDHNHTSCAHNLMLTIESSTSSIPRHQPALTLSVRSRRYAEYMEPMHGVLDSDSSRTSRPKQTRLSQLHL